MIKNLLFSVLLLSSIFVNAQNKVTLKNNGKITQLTIKEKATYQNINDKISIAIIAQNGMLLELNNLTIKQFTGNSSRFNSNKFKLVLIDNKKNITYVSTSNIQILSTNTKNKDEYKITFSGIVKKNKTNITVNGTLLVTVLPKQHYKTN